ncbi:MAG: acetyl-CoA decarbonylase/synthase complex subunit delta [bacterium]
MAVEILKESYSGKIREEIIGTLPNEVKVGSEEVLPFHLFEGNMPNPPKIALEVYDEPPEDWADACLKPWADVIDDPVKWAKKAIEEYDAEMICLQLASTDPNGSNKSAEEAAELVKKVTDEVNVPVIVYGSDNVEKDIQVLKKVAEICEGKNLYLGAVKEDNHKTIGAAAMGYKQGIVAQTPNDVNLAKQLNILLENLGLPLNKIVMDTTTGGLGYGIEYTYTIIERLKLAALTQNDDKVQMPIINNLACEVWKLKEVKTDDPTIGDTAIRGILWEAITAFVLAIGGSDILIMRHPQSAKLVKKMIVELMS